jgi:hypothetical protein
MSFPKRWLSSTSHSLYASGSGSLGSFLIAIEAADALSVNSSACSTQEEDHEWSKDHLGRALWFKPIILAIKQAEIRRIHIQSQSQAINSGDPTSKKHIVKKGWWCGSSSREPA